MQPQVNYIICNNLDEEYRMVYYAWGIPEKCNKTLVCLHGLNRNGRDWDYMAKYFINQGFFVIAPDIVGRGNSDYLIDSKGYDMPFYASDILKLIATLSLQNVSLLGTSMGGLVGMAIAAMPGHPIQNLILNDIGAEIEFEGLKIIANYSKSQPEFDTFIEAKEYLISTSKEFGDLPAEVWEYMARNSLQKNAHGKYELKRDVNLVKPFANGILQDKNIELWDYWAKIKVPTLIIRGEKSYLLSRSTVNKMKDMHDLTQSFEIANAGHAPFLYLDSQAAMINKFLQS